MCSEVDKPHRASITAQLRDLIGRRSMYEGTLLLLGVRGLAIDMNQWFGERPRAGTSCVFVVAIQTIWARCDPFVAFYCA